MLSQHCSQNACSGMVSKLSLTLNSNLLGCWWTDSSGTSLHQYNQWFSRYNNQNIYKYKYSFHKKLGLSLATNYS